MIQHCLNNLFINVDFFILGFSLILKRPGEFHLLIFPAVLTTQPNFKSCIGSEFIVKLMLLGLCFSNGG